MKFVDIVHEELGRSRVLPSALSVWLERGWKTVNQEDSSLPELPFASPRHSADEPAEPVSE